MSFIGNGKEVFEKFFSNFSLERLKEKLRVSAFNILYPSVLRNFAEGGRPQAWKVSNRVKGEYRKMYRGSWRTYRRSPIGAPRTLEMTGSLKRSIAPFIEFPYAGVVVKRPTPHARVHQFGIRRNNLGFEVPARPFLVAQDEDIEKIQKIFFEVK